MRNVPVWIDDTSIRKFPKLQRNISAEVLVVGAGITGITAAYLLKKAGSTVALIERERVASIDTGHTTAHLTYVTDVQLQQLVRNFVGLPLSRITFQTSRLSDRGPAEEPLIPV